MYVFSNRPNRKTKEKKTNLEKNSPSIFFKSMNLVLVKKKKLKIC